MDAPNHMIARKIVVLLAGFSLTAQCAERAANALPASASAPPNLQFLEYLGTLEGDDENWTDIGEAVAVREQQPSANEQSASRSRESEAKDSKVRATADAEKAQPVERK